MRSRQRQKLRELPTLQLPFLPLPERFNASQLFKSPPSSSIRLYINFKLDFHIFVNWYQCRLSGRHPNNVQHHILPASAFYYACTGSHIPSYSVPPLSASHDLPDLPEARPRVADRLGLLGRRDGDNAAGLPADRSHHLGKLPEAQEGRGRGEAGARWGVMRWGCAAQEAGRRRQWCA